MQRRGDAAPPSFACRLCRQQDAALFCYNTPDQETRVGGTNEELAVEEVSCEAG